MTECNEISNDLMDYINRKLTQEQNSRIVSHLAICKVCRNETADLIKIKCLEQKKMADVPQEILNSAFKKINAKEEESTLQNILSSDSYLMAFDIIRYSFTTVKQTIQLAKQAL